MCESTRDEPGHDEWRNPGAQLPSPRLRRSFYGAGFLLGRLRCRGGSAFRLNFLDNNQRKQVQRCIGADGEQLIIRIDVC